MLAAVLQLNGFAAGGTVTDLAVLEAYVGKSGRSIIVVIQDQGVDTTLAAGTGDATISINGGAPITLAVKNVNQSVVYMPAEPTAGVQNFTIVPGDSVVFTAPSGWVTANSGTDLSPAINQTLTNRVGVEHLVIEQSAGTMPVGWNLSKPKYFNPIRMYNNEVKLANRFSNANSIYDANGYPTSISGTTEAIINQCNSPSGEGWEGMEAGTWKIMWDGLGNCTLANQGGNTTVVAGSASTGNAVDNFREYDVAISALPGGIKYAVTSVPVSNIRIYPPGVDPAQKFRQEFLDQLHFPKFIRLLDAISTNGSNHVNFSDYITTNSLTYFKWQDNRKVLVTSFENWTNDGFFEASNYVYVKCNCATAHGYVDGMTVDFENTNTITVSTGTISAGTDRHIRVIDATSFAFQVFKTGGGTVTGVQSQPANAAAYLDINGNIPIADIVELCNLKQSNLWWNVSHIETDASVTSVANYIRDNLDSNLKCIVEFSNEHWNFAVGYNQSRYCYGRGQFDATIVAATTNVYYRGNYWYAQRATEVHDLFVASWNAGGRSLSTLVRILGSQFGNSQITTNILFWAVNTLGKTIDGIAFAPYWDNNIVTADAAIFTNNVSIDQLTDLTAAVVEHDTLQDVTRWNNHQTILNSYPTIDIYIYETGPVSFAAGSTVGPEKSRAVARDPRIRYCQNIKLKTFEEKGCIGACIFLLGDAFGTDATTGGTGNANWATFYAFDQIVGLGDGSDGLFDNRTAYDDHANTVSVVGYAIHAWMDQFVTITPPVIVPVVPVPARSVQSEIFNLCQTIPFFSPTMYYDFEKVKFPILSFERDAAILVGKHSCGTREEEFNVFFHSYAYTFTDIFDVHSKLKNLLEFRTIQVSNRNVYRQEFGREEIIEEEPGIFHGIYVIEFGVEKHFSVQQNLTDITYGSNLFDAINKRFNAHTDLVQKSELFFNFANELKRRPYSVIDSVVREVEWQTTVSRIDNNRFVMKSYVDTFEDAEYLVDKIEDIFDYCRLGLPNEQFTICDWQGNHIQELEPGIWSGEVTYDVLTEKSIS